MKNTIIKLYHEENRYYKIFTGSEALETKRFHVEDVLNFTEKLFDVMTPPNIDKDLLLLCAEHHDDGRVNQFQLLGKFWDTEVSHNVLGLERFDTWLNKSSFVNPIDSSIQIFRDVILYHGKQNLCSNEFSKPYVELVTAADDLENAAACVSYLIREVETDAKGYRHDNPEADQTAVSDFVFEHFANGEKFDKMKYCKTYAEYVLFAATLMTSCINKYDFAKSLLEQPGYGYNSILEGYKAVFEATLSEELAKKAYNILLNYAK